MNDIVESRRSWYDFERFHRDLGQPTWDSWPVRARNYRATTELIRRMDEHDARHDRWGSR